MSAPHNGDDKFSFVFAFNIIERDRMPIAITAYDHFGIRVTDAKRALAFYADPASSPIRTIPTNASRKS